MNAESCLYEGDFCFLLPASCSNQSQFNEEPHMKARSESASKAKGGATPPQAFRSDESSSRQTGQSPCSREQMIAEAAYYRAERRGFEPGDEMSDWLQAEADVEAVLGSLH
jgi:hypothetical protein